MTFHKVCIVSRHAEAKSLNLPQHKVIKLKIFCQNSVSVATVRERAWWLISPSQDRVMLSSQPVNSLSCFSGSVLLHLHRG